MTPDPGPDFSKNFDSGSGSEKAQNPAGVDSGTSDPWPPLTRGGSKGDDWGIVKYTSSLLQFTKVL